MIFVVTKIINQSIVKYVLFGIVHYIRVKDLKKKKVDLKGLGKIWNKKPAVTDKQLEYIKKLYHLLGYEYIKLPETKEEAAKTIEDLLTQINFETKIRKLAKDISYYGD